MTKPPYLNFNKITKENSYTNTKIKERKYESPTTSFNQKFAGTWLTGDLQQRLVFDKLKDTDSQFAFHRFSWISNPNPSFDPNWVAELWKFWISNYGHVRDGLAWHPYTASERLVNILRFFY